MGKRVLQFTLLAAIAAFAGVATFAGRTAAQDNANPADAAPAPFAPNMGDMMSMLIQPRHAKLALAGKAENWVLAGYVLRELQQGFGTIAKTIPRWKALPVSELIDAALKQPFATMDLAIKSGDIREFAASFDRITAGCNACHSTADQSFVVIKTPDASVFPNQEFDPGRR
jgi:hypothetical protein